MLLADQCLLKRPDLIAKIKRTPFAKQITLQSDSHYRSSIVCHEDEQ